MGIFDKSKDATSVESKKLHSIYGRLLTDGEVIETGIAVFRDVFLFTNKRLVLVTAAGLTGRQIEYLSIPYSSVKKFSIQTGESFGLDAELKLWVGNDALPIEKKFSAEVNVYEVQKLLAGHVLKAQ